MFEPILRPPLSRALPACAAAALLFGCAADLRPQAGGRAAECQALFEDSDARIQKAAAGDASLYRVPGFRYLRSTRFLASFRGEVEDDIRFAAWMAEMRAEDQYAREEEILASAGKPAWDAQELELRQRLEDCGRELLNADFADPARRQRLREAVRVPDDYSLAQRVLGLYPLAVPFLRLGFRGYQDEVRADYAAPLTEPEGARLVLWNVQAAGLEPVPAEEAAAWMQRGKDHPLGIPALEYPEIERLLQTHAPSWWVEQRSDADRPGSPYIAGGAPAFDPSRAQTYVLMEYTRFGGRVLPQLVYIVWFAERPAQGSLDPYAGRFDGLVWRVTLGADGRPLVYDTIHPCGCYHTVFPARALRQKPQAGFWREPLLVPQSGVGEGPLAVRIAAGTHYVRRVVPLAQARGDGPYRYALVPYGELTFSPDEDRHPRSLFDSVSGLVSGSDRLERWWLWPSGVHRPGAMRAWGRHATAFVGRRHFDEPFLLDSLFEPPEDAP